MSLPKNVALDPDLLARITHEAKKEGRTPDDLANEAAKRFLALRSLQSSRTTASGEPKNWASRKMMCRA